MLQFYWDNGHSHLPSLHPPEERTVILLNSLELSVENQYLPYGIVWLPVERMMATGRATTPGGGGGNIEPEA